MIDYKWKGRLFQIRAAKALSQHFGVKFQLDHPIPIGTPPKEHQFDLVSVDSRYVGECKNYSWTKTGRVPSAKLSMVNEAVFYLSFLPPETVKFVVMRKTTHAKQLYESLAEYYHRTRYHLLNGVLIFEMDEEGETLRRVRDTSSPRLSRGFELGAFSGLDW
jgi:hypothetical protein